MTGVLKFPKLGSEKTLALYEKPTPGDEETTEDYQARQETFRLYQGVEVTVKLVDRETARAWSMRWESIITRDKTRLEEQKKRGDGESEISQEGVSELIKLQRDILKASLVKISGIEYGDTLLETVTNTTQLIEMIDGCGLLSACSICASRAQAPSPKQGEA